MFYAGDKAEVMAGCNFIWEKNRLAAFYTIHL